MQATITKVRVDTTHFEFAHAKKPSGRGGWAFAADPEVDANDQTIIWVSGLYSEAKRQAVKIAAERGWDYLAVLS